MKFVDEFRDPDTARALIAAIAAEADPERDYRIMEFCGGHTHAIFRAGLPALLPNNVRYLHGPGCPVCVLPAGRLDNAIELAEHHGVLLCSYGDMLRVPASSGRSLLSARAAGADVRMVTSPREALQLARANPQREVVFFAIGFETTTPPSAAVLLEAHAEGLENFSLFCNHVLTPPAMGAILDDPACAIDALLGPSHVSTIIGSTPYEPLVTRFQRPLVIAGFEALDVLQSTLMAIRQLNAGRCRVENEYSRAVSHAGNRKAQALMAEVFVLRPSFAWRGLGELAESALQIREPFAAFDAERRFALTNTAGQEQKGCACPEVLRGITEPEQCRLFGTACTPENPLGACMVSSEGACAAHWRYGRFEARQRA